MRAIFFAALLLLFAAQGFSQQKLTLGEAIRLAKKNNSDYVIAKLDKLKAEKKVSEVYSENLVPTFTLSSRYVRAFKKQTISIFGQTIELGTDNSIVTTLDVSEPIPFLGTPVMNGIKIARYYSRLQDESVNQIESKIKADVTKAFYNVLLLKEVVELNKQSIANSEENLRVVEARNRAGVALEYDVIRARVKVETLRPQITQAENNLEIAKKVFKNTIGLKDGAEVDATGYLIYDSTEVWGSTDGIIRNISEKNVAIRQLKLSKKINEELVDVDYANYLPKLYLFGQYSLQANENDETSISRYRFFNSLTAGIGLSWDLNLFRNSYKEDQSIIEVRKSEERIAQVKEGLKVQAESVLLRIEDAKNRIKAQKDLVMQAERGLELATASYKAGVLNQIDVVDAELSLSQVKLLYVQAIYDYLVARTDLEQLLER
ncbi:MAG TPA: TolC family protein [Ignavibacteria bacterium]